MPTQRAAFTASLALALLACIVGASGARAQESKQAQAASVKPSDAAARGIELFRRGETDAATKALRDATKKDKTDADAWHFLGLALVKEHKPKDARKAFENAVRLRPDFVAALNGLAYVLISQNDLGEASRVVDNSLKVEAKNAETHYLRGAIFIRTDSFSRALAEAEESEKINPNYPQALYLKSESLIGMIAKELGAASDETPDVRETLLKKVAARFDEAAAALEKFTRLSPQSAEAASLAEQIKTMRVYGEMSGAPTPERTVFSAKEVTTKAVVLSRPEPLYTERARADQITGSIVIRMVLAADGTMKYIFPVTRLPDGLTDAAIRAARAIKFIPATKDGRPVAQYATIQYNFNIY
jgi:TonB family protein